MTRNQRFESHAGHQTASYHKQQERAMREAYRREKKIESYLADDENFPSFAIQLKKLGLALRDIPADGNCLFRALGDQLEGHGRNHYRHRQDVVSFMLDNRTDFEPFVEDDMSFDEHIQSLKKLGTHAGNDAIVAFAKLHSVNVMIHQLNGKPLLIQGPSGGGLVRQLHIAYHNGDHYSSIRRLADNTESPADIWLQDDMPAQALPASGRERYGGGSSGVVTARERYGGGSSGVVTAKRGLQNLEEEVVRATGCRDMNNVRETLHDCDYDVDAAIATLLQTLEISSTSHIADDRTSPASRHMSDSGIWADNGSGTRIFGAGAPPVNGRGPGEQNYHLRADSFGGSSGYSSMGSNKGCGARPKLPGITSTSQQTVHNGRKSKDVKKMEKKMRATERHRQRVCGQADPQQQQPQLQDDTLIIRHDITRI